MKIIHIINPFISNKNNNKIVDLTLNSMVNAKHNIMYDDLSVDLCYTCYEEDLPLLKNNKNFKKLSLLDRSILDIKHFNKKRKLPLVFDILNKTSEVECEYIIFSNIDIHIVPNFYNEVYKYILMGYETITINRVTIYNDDILNTTIDNLYNLVPNGEFHPGMDCFVFKKEVYDSIKKIDLCIGVNYFDKYLFNYAHNNSSKSVHFLKSFLTFHIGDDRDWLNEIYSDYVEYNKNLYNLNNCAIPETYCEYDISKDDDYLFYSKYHYSMCENFLDHSIIKYFRKIKFYDGKFLDIGPGKATKQSKTYLLIMCGWSGVFVEHRFNFFNELYDEHVNNTKIKLINTKIDTSNSLVTENNQYTVSSITIDNLIDNIGTMYDFITLNVSENVVGIIKSFPPSLLHNCKLISVNYNTSEEMYNINYFLNIHGFNEIVNNSNNNITLSKY